MLARLAFGHYVQKQASEFDKYRENLLFVVF